MRKVFLLLLALMLILSTAAVSGAEPAQMTKQLLVEKALASSFKIRNAENGIFKLHDEYAAAMVNLRQYSFYKEMTERLLELSKANELSTADIIEQELINVSLSYYPEAKDHPMQQLPKDVRTLNLKYTLEVYEQARQSAKNSIIINIVSSLSEIERINQAINLQRALASNLSSGLEVAKRKLSLGAASKLQVEQLQLRYKLAQAELSKLNLQRTIAYEGLSKHIGQPIDKDNAIINNDKYEVGNIQSLDYYLGYAYKNRRDLKQVKNLSSFKNIDYQRAIQNYGIESKSEAFRNAYIAYQESVNNLEDLEINIQIQVNNAYKEVERQLVYLQRYKNDSELAEQRYKEAQMRYKLGQETDLSLSSINSDFVKSRNRYMEAQSNAYIAVLKLKNACGMLLQ